MKDNFHTHKSCSDQRSDVTEGVRKLFNKFLTCEHILTPLVVSNHLTSRATILFNIIDQHSVTENANDTNIPCVPKQSGIHSQCKHTNRNTFGKSNTQYHDFDNQDSFTFTDKYTALLQQELQNPYWNLHDP